MSAETAEERFSLRFERKPDVIAAAPGRIEFIGNHTDYNGGTVLGAAIDRTITVSIAARPDGVFRFYSTDGADILSLRRDQFSPREGADSWVNYPLGVLLELEAAGMPELTGFDLHVWSDLPVGAGLSSSAALEMSTAAALRELIGFPMSLEEMVRAARRAENRFVGVPCGILDQGVSGFGRRDHLVHIDCATEMFSTVPLPSGVHFWIFNTDEKHNLVDSLYAERHGECAQAKEALEALIGPVPHLARIEVDSFASHAGKLPEVPRKRAQHVIEENARVEAAVRSIECGDLKEVGRLLVESHWSSSRLFENSTPALDLLVELTSAVPEVYGSRLTGGGFGGAVMAMTSPGFNPVEADAVVEEYCRQRPNAPRPSVFHVQAGDGVRLLEGN